MPDISEEHGEQLGVLPSQQTDNSSAQPNLNGYRESSNQDSNEIRPSDTDDHSRAVRQIRSESDTGRSIPRKLQDSNSGETVNETPEFERLEDKTLNRVENVFVPPPDYESKTDDELLKSSVFIVYGRPQTGKRACAIDLALMVSSEGKHRSKRRTMDGYSRYEAGLDVLLREFEQRKIGMDISSLRQRLLEFIEESRQHGDNENHRTERSKIINELDRIASDKIGITFTKLCEDRKPRPKSEVSLMIYNRALRDHGELVELLQKHKPSKKTVCIIEEVFNNAIEPAMILPKMPKIAADKNICVILTTTLPEDRLRDFDIPLISTSWPDSDASFMRGIFETHLRFYQEFHHIESQVAGYTKDVMDKLLKNYLEYPNHINQFCEALSELPLEAGNKDIDELAEQIGRTDKRIAPSWFKRLSENEKLYAMFVFLFSGIDRLILDEIYILAVQRLRSDGLVELKDHRTTGLVDLLKTVRAREDEGQVVFSNPVFEEEVRNQIRNHHHLLWSFIYTEFPGLSEVYRDEKYWILRQSLGKAIGRVGIYHIHKLDEMLEALACSPYSGVVAVVGYALDDICRMDPRYYMFVVQLLQRWVTSKNSDLMWATGDVIWRIYHGVVETSVRELSDEHVIQSANDFLKTLWGILKHFAEHFDCFTYPEVINNIRCIVYTIRHIAFYHPNDGVKYMTEWIYNDIGGNASTIAMLSSYILFEYLDDTNNHLIENHHGPLLDLVEPLLSNDEDILQRIMRILLGWVEQEAWANKVQHTLLKVVNRASTKIRAAMREHCSKYWSINPLEEVQRIAHTIIARSYVMDGIPMEIPGERYGIIVLDNTYEASKNNICLHVAQQLYHRLSSYMDMYVIPMGCSEWLAQPSHPPSKMKIHSRQPKPRLLLPALEHLYPEQSYYVLVLTWGPIIDFDDIRYHNWRDRLVIVQVNCQEKWLEDSNTLTIDHPLLSEQDIYAIEMVAQRQKTQVLARLATEEWHTPGGELLDAPCNQYEVPGKLLSWIEQLDDLVSTELPLDLARSILCTILRLSFSDLPCCVELLCSWLASKSELSRQMGVACGKALFTLHGERQPLPPLPQYELLLDLVAPLAEQDWDVVEIILRAARRWAAHPDWATRLTTRPDNDTNELSQMIDAQLSTNRDKLETALKGWSDPLRDESAKEVPLSVRILAAQLLLRMRIGPGKHLPTLLDGTTYGIIVVDVFARSARSRKRLAKLASLLAKRIKDSYREQILLLIYRLGQDRPLFGLGDRTSTDILPPFDIRSRPRLLGPVLESHDIKQIGFLLLLTNDTFLDARDWEATEWRTHINIYRDDEIKPWNPPFPVIETQATVEEAVDYILKQLALPSKRKI